MKSFLLLILPLMAGCDDSSEVNACGDGWVDFTCKYPKSNKTYKEVQVLTAAGRTLSIYQTDMWKRDDRFLLYHDTKHKNLRVVIKPLEQEDFGEYKCKFYQQSNSVAPEVTTAEVESGGQSCGTNVKQTVNTGDKLDIMCDYSRNEHTSWVKFFCKDNDFTCEDILSTKSALKTNKTFTLTVTNRGFSVSISQVSSQDAGVYWCGVQSPDGNMRATRKRIQLEVKEVFPVSPKTTTASIKSSTAHHPTSVTAVTQVTSSTTQHPAATTSVPSTHHDNSQSTVIITAVTCVALLVLVLVLVIIYKRFERSKNRTKETQKKETHVYEEIKESTKTSDTGAAMKSVYVTANFPTNPSAFMDYSKVGFAKLPGEVNIPTYSTVTHPSVSEDPIYSTINQMTEQGEHESRLDDSGVYSG